MTTTRKIAPILWAVVIIGSVLATPIIGFSGPFEGGNGEAAQSGLREYFLPAEYAFLIWGVIYLGLVALGIWIALPAQRDNPRARRAAPWLAVTAFFNLVWIALAGDRALVPWTVLALVVMEVTAWVAYFRLGIDSNRKLPRMERWLHLPFRVYVGWLSVATVANTAAALNALGWDGWGIEPVTWTLIMLAAATLIALVVGWLMEDNVYLAVFVWAFVAIVVEQADVPVVAWTAGVLAGVIAAIILGSTIYQRPSFNLLETGR